MHVPFNQYNMVIILSTVSTNREIILVTAGDQMNYAFAVTICPPLQLTVGEMYNDTSCTTDTKFYGDTCDVSCTLGYNLTTTDGVHECTENGTWSNTVTCERM